MPWEYESRKFTAFVLNKGFKTSKYKTDNVIYANSMEGIGFSQAMEDFNQGKKSKIPYVMMRAASDYSHKPLVNMGEGVWKAGSLEPSFSSGYAQASELAWTLFV